MFVNVYMPCQTKRKSSSFLSEMSAEDIFIEVISCLSNLNYDSLIIGGDFNSDLCVKTNFNSSTFEFIDDCDLIVN